MNLSLSSILYCLILLPNLAIAQKDILKFVRYELEGKESYGILKGESIEELQGDLFSAPVKTGSTVALSRVNLLAPCSPSKVLAVGLNYRSHIGDRPIPDHMGLFAKYPTCIIAHQAPILMPSDATDLHYEGELVVVIGKIASKISVADAPDYIFGVTAGNDVSERNWQKIDLQWLRAKGSDTFGPMGPAIVTGLDYNNLLLQTRLNGKVVQSERSKDLIYSVDEIVSYISHYVTMFPGDVIFTGTPGSTQAMQPGDIVEIELEGVGVLSNTVQRAEK
ncbi:MAG: fumarylacetoacetate hydrolase family protein [Saprospiraceae bacterium]|nr:fumarylacetoacetate hydrolase family protein [Saprospiraceae bacterium]